MLEHALQYASELAWRVFPVWGIALDGSCECGGRKSCEAGKHSGKHPIAELAPRGFRDATMDPTRIRDWWTRYPSANIGLSCDASGIVVVDCDPRNGSEQSVDLLRAEGHHITSPLRALTGGGGSHDFFRAPDADWKGEKFAGIDLKHAGYVILPPSKHKSGRSYAWGPGCDPFESAGLIGLPELPDCFTSQGELALADDADDLELWHRQQPLKISEEEVREHLKWLPLDDWCDDYDGWLRVGGALHHQFEAQERGLELFREFSMQSSRFQEGACEAKWRRGFKGAKRPSTMRTLIRAASIARDIHEQEFAASAANDHLQSSPAAKDDIDAIGDTSAKRSDLKWVSLLDRNEEGAVKPTLHNLEIILANDPRTAPLPNLNEFTQEVVRRARPGVKSGRTERGIVQLDGPVWRLKDPVNGDLWTDELDFAVRAMLEAPRTRGGYGFKVTDRDLRAAIDLVARRQPFHPIREYLDGLVWDGQPRAERLFIDYLGASDTPYTRQVASVFLTAAVTRAYEPGHKFDFAPILEGLQGKRKSTFIRTLAKHWSAELEGDFHDPKSMVEKMQGAWILEIPELSGFGRSDVRTIKAFMSRAVDKVRLAYDRRARDFPRQCVFMGSTNDREYLRDDTGGRRFWPVPCHVGEIDTERLEQEVDLLWAEAVVAYRLLREQRPIGTLPLYLTDDAARDEALRIQEDRRVETAEDALIGQIEAWLERPLPEEFEDADDLIGAAPRQREETWLLQIWTKCLGNERRTYDQRGALMLGRAMRRLQGWESVDTPRRTDDGMQRVYRRAGVSYST